MFYLGWGQAPQGGSQPHAHEVVKEGGGCCRGVLGVVLVVFADSCGLASCVRSVFYVVVVTCCSYVFAVGPRCR